MSSRLAEGGRASHAGVNSRIRTTCHIVRCRAHLAKMQSVQVAWAPCRGYAARVSRLHFQRWAVIFLLVSKLIFGEVTHAMPHMAAPATEINEVATSASQDSPPCADHVQAGSESDSSQDSNTD